MLSLNAVASVTTTVAHYIPEVTDPAVFNGRFSLVNSLLLALVEVSDTWILLHFK